MFLGVFFGGFPNADHFLSHDTKSDWNTIKAVRSSTKISVMFLSWKSWREGWLTWKFLNAHFTKFPLRQCPLVKITINDILLFLTQHADLSTSPLTINSERLQVLEFSKPFMQFTMSLISKKLDTNDHDLTTFMLPYSTTVWLVTLACLLFVTVLMYLVNLFSPYGHRSSHMQYGETGEEFDFFNSLWFCLASMLQQGADHTPKSLSG